jgi:DNA gyrase, A subunit
MSENFIAKETIAVSLEEEMKQSYLDYAMSVVVSRALPDARDGMKPVHRRVLYAMYELHNDWNKPFKKSARVVGDVIGKYHPHGESAVYDTIVRLAQDFSMRYPLINGQGNFGSIDGDSAAAMRYTEIRLQKITAEILSDLDKQTVDFAPNYDNNEQEPIVLPSKVPVLLINGSSGIAVGMATNIPPHNLGEVIDASLALLDNENLSVQDLMEFVLAPDFPTGGIIYGLEEVKAGYLTGRGRVVMRGKVHTEILKHRGAEREAIIIDELPYQVNKAKLVEKIGILVREKSLEGIADLRDESDKSGIRVVIELKRHENAEVIINQLYKLTPLQDSFGMNMIALVDGYPKQLNLKDFISEFLKHRREVIYRRTLYDLRKAKARGHILEGLAVALANVDEMIALIKASPTPPEAKANLLARPWHSEFVKQMLASAGAPVLEEGVPLPLQEDGYHLSEIQAQAILDMRLQRLTGLEQDKIIKEYEEVCALIADLLDILGKHGRITEIIREELKEIRNQFADSRRTEIDTIGGSIDDEDLIPTQEMVVTLSHQGYIKAQPVQHYQVQRRGGRGRLATTTKEEDFIKTLFAANSHDYLLCFTTLGKCYWIKVYKLPMGSRTSRGRPVNNVLKLSEGEAISAILPIDKFADNEYVFMCTALGIVKKTPLMNFSKPKANGIIAVNLRESDRLVGAVKTGGNDEIMLFSDQGKAVRFAESDVRPMGRGATGVRGMRLPEGGKVVSLLVNRANDQEGMILAATKHGYGKRTEIENYRKSHRGSQGVIAIDTGIRNGQLVAAARVQEMDDVMLITSGGVLIRTQVAQIRRTDRAARGVKLINLDQGEDLVSIERIAETKETEIGEGESTSLN